MVLSAGSHPPECAVCHLPIEAKSGGRVHFTSISALVLGATSANARWGRASAYAERKSGRGSRALNCAPTWPYHEPAACTNSPPSSAFEPDRQMSRETGNRRRPSGQKLCHVSASDCSVCSVDCLRDQSEHDLQRKGGPVGRGEGNRLKLVFPGQLMHSSGWPGLNVAQWSHSIADRTRVRLSSQPEQVGSFRAGIYAPSNETSALCHWPAAAAIDPSAWPSRPTSSPPHHFVSACLHIGSRLTNSDKT